MAFVVRVAPVDGMPRQYFGLYSLSSKTSYHEKPRSREIWCYNDLLTLKFLLCSDAAEVPVKLQSDWKSVNPKLAASRLHEIL